MAKMKRRSRAERREEADDRQEEYEALSNSQKLSRAKSRRGESKREINRLVAQAKKGN